MLYVNYWQRALLARRFYAHRQTNRQSVEKRKLLAGQRFRRKNAAIRQSEFQRRRPERHHRRTPAERRAGHFGRAKQQRIVGRRHHGGFEFFELEYASDVLAGCHQPEHHQIRRHSTRACRSFYFDRFEALIADYGGFGLR